MSNNAEDSHSKNSTLAENIPVPNTPFVARMRDEKWFITMGDYAITEKFDTKEDAINTLETNRWEITVTLIAIALDKVLTDEQVRALKEKYEQSQATDKTPYETESL